MTSPTPQHGEVWWCEPPDIGRRPVVVLSREVAARGRGRAVIAPCTTVLRGLPSEVALEAERDPVPRDCVVSLDSLESVSLAVLVERVGRLSLERQRAVCRALAVAMDCD